MTDITHAKGLRDFIFRDPEVRKLYKLGDKLSSSQTKHDEGHAFQVLAVGVALSNEINRRIPEVLDEYAREIVIPIACFLHDAGRAINVDNHASAGAKWARGYLANLSFDRATVRKICRIIACHRSSIVLKPKSFTAANYEDAAWAVVVIADKAVGDEDRVRPEPLKELRRLRRLRRMQDFQGSQHDLVNYAIKGSCIQVDGREDNATDPGVIVLKLRIDRHVCPPSTIFTLFRERFHACSKAAQYLGFAFRLEFNGVRYAFCKEKKDWVPVTSIQVSGKKHA